MSSKMRVRMRWLVVAAVLALAKHTFCKHCGIHSFYVPRSDPDKIDVSARCIDGIDLTALKPKNFDGRHWE